MQEKTQQAYELVFQSVNNALGCKLDAATVTCDFEKALVNAAKITFGTARTKYVLCFFHFKQAIRRKLIDLRLPDKVILALLGGEVTSEDNGRNEKIHVVGHIDLLTVIPVEEIEFIGIPFIRSQMEEYEQEHKASLDEFWNKYFTRVWLKSYDPNDWNIGTFRGNLDDDERDAQHDDVDVVNRTNNALERHNRYLGTSFPNAHPSMIDFTKTLRIVSEHQAKKYRNISEGTHTPKKHAPLTRCSIPNAYQIFKQHILSLNPGILVKMQKCPYREPSYQTPSLVYETPSPQLSERTTKRTSKRKSNDQSQESVYADSSIKEPPKKKEKTGPKAIQLLSLSMKQVNSTTTNQNGTKKKTTINVVTPTTNNSNKLII